MSTNRHNKSPRKTKKQLRGELQECINELVAEGCTFWACPGPNKPIEDMATCKHCLTIKKLRRIRDEI